MISVDSHQNIDYILAHVLGFYITKWKLILSSSESVTKHDRAH